MTHKATDRGNETVSHLSLNPIGAITHMYTHKITDLADEYANYLYNSPTVGEYYKHAGEWYRYTAANLQEKHDLTISLVSNPEPYDTAADQAADVQRNGVFKVSTAHCDHPYWDTFTNVAYRIVHDLIGHNALTTTTTTTVPEFDVAGELQAWANQLDHLRQKTRDDHKIIAVSFSETVGQLAYAAVNDGFPGKQRAGLMFFNPYYTITDDR